MNQLGQSAIEKFAIPAVMVGYAYSKYMEEDRREQREARALEREAETREAGTEQGGGG
jgi:hypothetical protein